MSKAAYSLILAHLRGTSVAELTGIVDLPDRIFPGADFRQSPNCDLRSNPVGVDCVVVHATVIDSEETVSKFLDSSAKVSAHFVVHKDGTVTQMVPESMRAWHAGVSELDGISGVNDFSIGIEIVNRNDGIDPFTDAQYGTVAAIVRFLRARCAIPDSRIVSHAFIARPPGRKNDPVDFNFARLKGLLD